MKKISGFSCLISSIFFLTIVSAVYGLMYFASDIPDYTSLEHYNPPTISRLYSQDLELLTEYAYEPRIFTTIHDIPEQLINAFIAAEDKTFFENYGIDPTGILRSAIKNISNIGSGRRAIGASTITQQVVQSFIIGRKRSLDRKITEAILAYRISIDLSKEKILELYLNQIFLGNNSYGVTQAAKTYFEKDLSKLNLAEVAMLASLPKAPSSFSPYSNPKRLLERRNWVISRMYEEKMISEDEMIEYSKLDLGVVPKKAAVIAKGDFFYTEEVKKQVVELYGEDAVYTAGLTINTNLDPKIQTRAEQALQQGIEEYDKRHGWRGPLGKIKVNCEWKDSFKQFNNEYLKKNGQPNDKFKLAVVLNISAKDIKVGMNDGEETISNKNLQWLGKKISSLKKGDVITVSRNSKGELQLDQIPEVNGAIVVIENYTGKVLALVGGYNPSSTYFNRATQAQRQPGSAFKTMIYLAAMENGFTKDSVLMDEAIEISQGRGMPSWRPQNLTNQFNGAVTIQEAFTRSLNIPAIQVGVSLGLPKIYEVSSRLGLYPKPKHQDIPCRSDEVSGKYCKNYSLLLGAFETTLMKLTAAYATIASGGYQIEPLLINSIYDDSGNLVYKDQNISLFDRDDESQIRIFKQKLIRNDANSKILGLMRNAVSPQVKELKIDIAGKTGTTNDSLDTWFVGSSSDFTVGVFIGYDLPKSLGKKEIGATVARPVFMNFMKSMSGDIKDNKLGQARQLIEFIKMNDDLEEDAIDAIHELEQVDLEVINDMLKKPDIETYMRECTDCEDAFSIKSYMNQ